MNSLKQMNTKLIVQYRNANNNKSSNDFILEGTFSKAQFDRLVELGEEIVPREIGIRNPAMNFLGMDDFPLEGVDHGYCTLEYTTSSYGEFIHSSATAEPPNLNMSINEFLMAFENAPCDAVTEFNHMKLVAGL